MFFTNVFIQQKSKSLLNSQIHQLNTPTYQQNKLKHSGRESKKHLVEESQQPDVDPTVATNTMNKTSL